MQMLKQEVLAQNAKSIQSYERVLTSKWGLNNRAKSKTLDQGLHSGPLGWLLSSMTNGLSSQG